MRFSFLSFTEIAKLNTGEIICNHQIAKLNTRKMSFFSNRQIKYPRNLPFRKLPFKVKNNKDKLDLTSPVI